MPYDSYDPQFAEILKADGTHAGCVCHSPKRNRWAATWNAIPNEDENPSSYVFRTRQEAVDFLPVRYHEGSTLSVQQMHDLLRAQGRL